MDKSIFGSLFDLNNDGKLDTREQAAELMFFHDIVMGASEGVTEETDLDFDEFDEDDLRDVFDDDDLDFDDDD